MKGNKYSALLSDRSEEEYDPSLQSTQREVKLLTKEAAALFILHDISICEEANDQAEELKTKILNVYAQLAEIILNSELPDPIKKQLKSEFQEESRKYVNDLGKNDDEYLKFIKTYASNLIDLSLKKNNNLKKLIFCGIAASLGCYLLNDIYDFFS